MTNSVAEQAKELRKALKNAFSGVKFSVTSENFSGGSAIRIKWTDGVKESQVDEIVNKYKTISYCEASGEILGGGNCYVSTSREFTPEAFRIATERVCKYWGLPLAPVTVNQYNKAYIAPIDDIANVGNGVKRLSWLIGEELRGIDFLSE